jgi:hypothetical protein
MINTSHKSTQNKIAKFVIFTLFVFLSSSLYSQAIDASLTDLNSTGNSFNHSINMCPGGIIFGIYSANFAYLFSKPHGLVARFDYESVSKSFSGEKIDANGYAIILNYRYHFSGNLESIFVGSYARYRVYQGTGNTGTQDFNFTMPEFTFGLNVGKRWVWNSGFNINLALGYGFAKNSKNPDSDHVSFKNTLNKFEDEYDFLGPFLGEFSLGYAF